jgi:hypothetical protein
MLTLSSESTKLLKHVLSQILNFLTKWELNRKLEIYSEITSVLEKEANHREDPYYHVQ